MFYIKRRSVVYRPFSIFITSLKLNAMENFLKTQADYYRDKATKAKREANMWLIAILVIAAAFIISLLLFI